MLPGRRTALALLATGALAGVLAACARPPAANPPAGVRPVVLERDFAGTLTGTGRFESGIAGVDRGFRITTHGRWDGTVLTLREEFLFDDGERDVKTWRFRKVAEGRYVGTREDVIGTADVVAENGVVRLEYVAELAGADGGGGTRVRFRDVIYRSGPGTILNRAVVSRFGLPVGTVEVSFRRP